MTARDQKIAGLQRARASCRLAPDAHASDSVGGEAALAAGDGAKDGDGEFEGGTRATPEDVLIVSQDAYEGPLELLLELVRARKVDINAISILSVIDTFFDWMRQARDLRLELAADWIVMMANLAFLKSKLLLPAPRDPSADRAQVMIEDLAMRLRRLDSVRSVLEAIQQRPRLGQTWHGPGEALGRATREGKRLDADLHGLLVAYKREARHTVGAPPAPVRRPFHLVSIEDAIKHLEGIDLPEGMLTELLSLLPPIRPSDPMHARSRIAATYVAALELAKQGLVEVEPTDDGRSIALRAARAA